MKDKFKIGDIIYWKDQDPRCLNNKMLPTLIRIVAIDNKYYYEEGINRCIRGHTEKRYCELKYEKIPELKRILLYAKKEKTEKEKKDFIRSLQRDMESMVFQSKNKSRKQR